MLRERNTLVFEDRLPTPSWSGHGQQNMDGSPGLTKGSAASPVFRFRFPAVTEVSPNRHGVVTWLIKYQIFWGKNESAS